MKSSKNNFKMTGDTHLAEIESDYPVEEGSPLGLGTRGMQSGLVGHAVKKAGVIINGEDGTPVASGPATDNPALAIPLLLQDQPAKPDA